MGLVASKEAPVPVIQGTRQPMSSSYSNTSSSSSSNSSSSVNSNGSNTSNSNISKTTDIFDDESSGKLSNEVLASLEGMSLEDAYLMGVRDTSSDTEAKFLRIAAQSYDNVKKQLSLHQEAAIKESQASLNRLKERFKTIQPVDDTLDCHEQSTVLMKCLEANKDNALLCSDAVDKFTLCSSQAYQKKCMQKK